MYYIKQVESGAYALVDADGAVVPHQIETTLKSTVGEPTTFTVVFYVSDTGLRMMDEGVAPNTDKG